METIFDGMSEFETERVYTYGEFKTTVTKQSDNKYFINIDSGNYDLINNESDEYSEFNCLKSTINKGWLFDWYCESEGLHCAPFDNGCVFQINEINIILNAIKNTYEFIKTHNWSIKNIGEQTFNAGKMVLKYKKIGNDVYQCRIEGMKNGEDLDEDIYEKYAMGVYCVKFYDDDEFMIDNIKEKSNYNSLSEDDYFKFTLMGTSGSYYEQYVDINNFKVTTNELEKLKIALKKCSDRLHDLNEKFDIQNVCMDFSENRTDIRIYGSDAYKFAIKYYDQMKKEITKY